MFLIKNPRIINKFNKSTYMPKDAGSTGWGGIVSPPWQTALQLLRAPLAHQRLHLKQRQLASSRNRPRVRSSTGCHVQRAAVTRIPAAGEQIQRLPTAILHLGTGAPWRQYARRDSPHGAIPAAARWPAEGTPQRQKNGFRGWGWGCWLPTAGSFCGGENPSG